MAPTTRSLTELITRIAVPVLFLALWQGVAWANFYPQFLFPSPIAVARKGIELIKDGFLLDMTWISFRRQMIGFVLGSAVGVVAGLALGISRRGGALFLPLLKALYPIPGIAWVPLAILWFGIGNTSIIFVVFLASIWPPLFSTIAGVQAINPNHLRAAQALGASRLTLYFRVYVPASLPFIITGLRLALGVSWRNIIGAEMIAGSAGLGFMIENAEGILSGSEIMVGMVVIGLIGYLVERIAIAAIEGPTIRKWGMASPQ